ncbi:protein-tyrosine phosphatase [Knoellia remsis]|uniref:Protein-tyrosine phosphatase n=1 Tax=Knoellia remsis TaxID=407159 RepID=A0A2T0UQL0_9MICO|nr:low molecular weight phosphatase family protein [Knoellia remsis]PRY60117.1 protein-tyrosine phosphatase [Knoellia remsis]
MAADEPVSHTAAPADARGGGHVLVVCTGNVCRSPYIERLLERDLRGTGISVSSAGTGALVGSPMDPHISVRLDSAGAPADGFTARQVTRRMMAASDLVITATREHLQSVVSLHPKAWRYSFALLDLADLLGVVDEHDLAATTADNRVAAIAAAAFAKRTAVAPRPPDQANIIDPYRQRGEVFDRMAAEIGGALPTVTAALRG